jgi:hypothetical protein
MSVTQINEHIAQALNRVLEEYKESPRLLFMLSTSVQQVQDLEDALIDLLDKTWINTAEGEQLDQLGLLLNVTRGGFSDAVYRTRLNAAIVRYTSSGRPEQVISAIRLLSQADQIILEELFPAEIRVTAIGAVSPAGTLDELKAGIKGSMAAAVSYSALIISSDTPFVFDGDPYPNGQGFGDVNDPSVGGNFAEIL